MKHIAVLDSGTTSTRAVLFDQEGQVVNEASKKISVFTPGGNRVEHDAKEIIRNSVDVLRDVLDHAKEQGLEVDCVAVTNQRTATTLMDRDTGEPVSQTIGWQDGSAMPRVESLKADWGERLLAVAGVNLGAANTPLHMESMLADPKLRARAEAGQIIAGTPDTLLVKALTGNWATSASNASSIGAMDIRQGVWWDEWLDFLGLSSDWLAPILAEDASYGETDPNVVGYRLPIAAVIADQQSALFGHGGFDEGAVKCTHGTGSFIDFNIGTRVPENATGYDARIGWRTQNHSCNAVEGFTPVSGSAIEWLIEDLKVLDSPQTLDPVSKAATDDRLIVVPALAGFAAPHWDAAARGTVFGLSRHTSGPDLVRATLAGVAHTVVDLLEDIVKITDTPVSVLKVDGGLARSNVLQQMTADLLQIPVERTADAGYVTARGAAWVAGVSRGLWASKEDAAKSGSIEARFEPAMSSRERDSRRAAWQDAVKRSLNWRAREDAE